MAGIQVPITRRATWPIVIPPAIMNLTQDVVVAQVVNTRGWRSGVLLLRVYAKTIPTNTSLSLIVRSVSIDPEDPMIIVRALSAMATITPASADATPTLYAADLPVPIGDSVEVLLRGQTTSGGSMGGLSTIECSIDLIGRDS